VVSGNQLPTKSSTTEAGVQTLSQPAQDQGGEAPTSSSAVVASTSGGSAVASAANEEIANGYRSVALVEHNIFH